jgi:hypothetical protein
MELQTPGLKVAFQTREEVERMIEAISDYEEAFVLAGLLAWEIT